MDVGRIFVGDNFFSSSELGKDLWRRLTYYLGTIRKLRKENPRDFLSEQTQV